MHCNRKTPLPIRKCLCGNNFQPSRHYPHKKSCGKESCKTLTRRHARIVFSNKLFEDRCVKELRAMVADRAIREDTLLRWAKDIWQRGKESGYNVAKVKYGRQQSCVYKSCNSNVGH